jgi:INO80 complex subunit C
MPKGTSKRKEASQKPKHAVARNNPFKNKHFTSRIKHLKSFKQIIQHEGYDRYSTSVATYQSIEAGPSTKPARKYCDLTGHLARYTDPKTGLRYCLAEQFALLKMLSVEHIDSFLSLRKAQAVLK